MLRDTNLISNTQHRSCGQNGEGVLAFIHIFMCSIVFIIPQLLKIVEQFPVRTVNRLRTIPGSVPKNSFEYGSIGVNVL